MNSNMSSWSKHMLPSNPYEISCIIFSKIDFLFEFGWNFSQSTTTQTNCNASLLVLTFSAISFRELKEVCWFLTLSCPTTTSKNILNSNTSSISFKHWNFPHLDIQHLRQWTNICSFEIMQFNWKITNHIATTRMHQINSNGWIVNYSL